MLTFIIKQTIRSVKTSSSQLEKRSYTKSQFNKQDQIIPSSKPHLQQQRTSPQDMSQQGLSKIRLNEQHLPQAFLKRCQQVFGKYDQNHLRQIAGLFSELMTLKYKQKKMDYKKLARFIRIQQQLSHERKVQKIILKSKEEALKQNNEEKNAKQDQDPIGIGIDYTQNLVLSYLLKRVPRTFATAVRIFTQIQFKYPKFKPTSMIDFGSGLSSGSYAFADIFGNHLNQLYNVEPNQKMFKLSKFLSQDIDIKHFRALGELSRNVKEVDLVYAGYVLSEIESQMIPLYIEALATKVKKGGFLVIAEYGNPFGSRLIHDIRSWAIQNKLKVVMPCPHQNQCPLASLNKWCHFDQPTATFPRRIFGKLPTQQSVQNQKFSYIVLLKQDTQLGIIQQTLGNETSNLSKNWERVLFPVIKKGGHLILDLCTKKGKFERRIIAKSHGQEYKQARKLKWGDLWRHELRIPNKYRKQSRKGKRLW